MLLSQLEQLNNCSINNASTLHELGRIFANSPYEEVIVVDEENKPIGVINKQKFIGLVLGYGLENKIESFVDRNILIIGLDEYSLEQALLLDGEYVVLVDQLGKFYGFITKEHVLHHYLKYFEHLSLLTALPNSCILLYDAEGYLRYLNPAAKRIFQNDNECSFFPALDKIKEALATKDFIYEEDLIYNHRTFLAFIIPIRKNKELLGVICVFHTSSEIGAIVKKLKQLHEINEELNVIIDTSYDGFAISDGRGVMIKVNKAHQRITGIAPEEFLGKHAQDLVEQGFMSDSVTMRVLKEHKPVTITQTVKNGKRIMVTGNPVFDNEGNIVRVVTNLRDLTELYELQEKLEETEQVTERYQVELEHLRKQQLYYDKIIADSSEMKQVLEFVLQIADKDANVLIQGETGVGKDVIAKIIHRVSSRRKGPYIKINCGAIPENLLESELFGYEEGAFTGAKKGGKVGLFELADGGTLFLDEIGELPLNLQVKLLRVLQEKEVVRVGGTKPIPINIRLICATNRNLKEMVAAGSFREDLYYRLYVVPIYIPPLRHRKKDIIPLVRHFLDKFNHKYGLSKEISEEALKRLVDYSWPGNVRELENLIERLVVSVSSSVITTEHIPELDDFKASRDLKEEQTEIVPLKEALDETEKRLIILALKKHKSMAKAAKVLGVDRTTVLRKINKYKIPYPYEE